jgi:hypothetical protein
VEGATDFRKHYMTSRIVMENLEVSANTTMAETDDLASSHELLYMTKDYVVIDQLKSIWASEVCDGQFSGHGALNIHLSGSKRHHNKVEKLKGPTTRSLHPVVVIANSEYV